MPTFNLLLINPTNKEIARALEPLATELPEVCEQHARLAVFKVCGSFKISCCPTSHAVKALAARIAKASNSYNLPRLKLVSTKRTYDAGAFNRFVANGEFSNAVNYCDAFDVPYSPRLLDLERYKAKLEEQGVKVTINGKTLRITLDKD